MPSTFEEPSLIWFNKLLIAIASILLASNCLLGYCRGPWAIKMQVRGQFECSFIWRPWCRRSKTLDAPVDFLVCHFIFSCTDIITVGVFIFGIPTTSRFFIISVSTIDHSITNVSWRPEMPSLFWMYFISQLVITLLVSGTGVPWSLLVSQHRMLYLIQEHSSELDILWTRLLLRLN